MLLLRLMKKRCHPKTVTVGERLFMARYDRYNKIVSIVDKETVINGFICKPNMIVISNDEGGLAVITRREMKFFDADGYPELYKLFAYELVRTSYGDAWSTGRYLKITDLQYGIGDLTKSLFNEITLDTWTFGERNRWRSVAGISFVD